MRPAPAFDLYGDMEPLPASDGEEAATVAVDVDISVGNMTSADVQRRKRFSPAVLGPSDGSACFVGNLRWWVTDVLVEEICSRAAGVPVAAVKFLEERLSGKSRGLALVEFADATAAERAVASLNGVLLEDRPLRAMVCQGPRNFFFSNPRQLEALGASLDVEGHADPAEREVMQRVQQDRHRLPLHRASGAMVGGRTSGR